MANLRVDEVTGRGAGQGAAEVEQVKRRTELHNTSAFEQAPGTFNGIGRPDLSAAGQSEKPLSTKPRSVSHRFGPQVIEIPMMSEADAARVEAIFARCSDRSRLELAARKLGGSAWAVVLNDVEGVQVTSSAAGLEQAAEEVVMMTRDHDERHDDTQDALFAGAWGAEQELHEFFGIARGRENMANEARTDISELESMLADWPDDGSTETFTYREIVIGEDGSVTLVERTVQLTKEEAMALLSELKRQLDSLSVITNRDSFQLQMMVQRYQEVTNTLSNILKTVDETQKGIIQNAKA